MIRALPVVLLLFVLVALGGCETLHDTFRWIGRANDVVDPKIDYANIPESGPLKRLALLFTPVDERIEMLERRVSVRESRPDAAWLNSMALDFPWVSGTAVVDTHGAVLQQVPETGIKPLYATEFLALSQDWKQTPLRAEIRRTDFGPEIYLLQPILEKGEWRGLLIVHFDPRNLMRYSPEPDRLMVLSGGAPLWPTLPKNNAEALVSVDWEDLIAHRVNGEVTVEGRTFTWLARTLGGKNIIYAVRNREGE